MKKEIIKNTIKRKLQLYAFIFLGLVGIGLIVFTVKGVVDPSTLIVLIPIILMMKRNAQMWEVYNDVTILQKYITDKRFRLKYKEENNI